MNTVIDKLVELRGVESNYIDAWGKQAEISDASKAKLLAAMGYSVDDDTQLEKELDEDIAKSWMTPLNPVQVNRLGEPQLTALRLPIELVNDEFVLKIAVEGGDSIEQTFVPSDGELINVAHIEDIEFQEYILNIAAPLPLGYHDISLCATDGDVVADMRFIMAPSACYKPESITDGNKVWGLSLQLYCLRSENNWGIGDFNDLAQVIRETARQGAQFVGLNPIHSLYPANPDSCSPYSPSSRRWLNFVYLHVPHVEGYSSAAVQKLIKSDDFQARLETVRSNDQVDYKGVTELKLEVLRAIFELQYKKHLSKNSKLNREFKAFIKAGGESLEMLACYDALQEQLALEGKDNWGWPVFPKEYRDFHSPAVQKFKKNQQKRIKFYLFLQWQAAQQLNQCHELAQECQMEVGIYRDLAVGVSEGSAEIWGNQKLYRVDASIGAPPDVLGPLGQNWGLPPMDPEQLYQQRYQPIIDLFDANMQASGALRIDHVMALLRLWWVPVGDDARSGGYVYYPVDDLLGILALESHRHQSLVIGEDLGTVPEEIREKLAANGVHSYRVFFFEQAEDGGFYSPKHYPVQSMATLTTHDMPTLEGFWHCHDLELGKELGLYPDAEVLQELYDSRHENKQQILDSLHGHGSIGDDIGRYVQQVGMSETLNQGMQLHMASGSSSLLSLQLEDWLQMTAPVNIPGTCDEYPNWRRKLSHNLEQIFADEGLNTLALSLTERRKQASGSR